MPAILTLSPVVRKVSPSVMLATVTRAVRALAGTDAYVRARR